MYYLIIDENLLKLNLNVESALMILNSVNETIAEFTYEVLSNNAIIKKGISIMGAKLIQKAENEEQAFNISQILIKTTLDEESKILELAKLINDSKYDSAKEIIYNIFSLDDNISYETKILIAKNIIDYDNELKLNVIDKILSNSYYYTKGIVYYLVLIINDKDILSNIKNIQNILKDDYEEFRLELTKDLLFFKV